MPVGRPKKYDEDCKGVSLSLPASLVDYLENIAKETNSTRNEIAITSIMSSNKDLLKKITNDIKTLRESYSNIADNYNKLSNKLKQNLCTSLYQDIEEDEKLNYFLKEFKTSHIKWIKNGITDSELLDKYEIWLYEKYKLGLKNKSLIKVILKNWITKVLKE